MDSFHLQTCISEPFEVAIVLPVQHNAKGYISTFQSCLTENEPSLTVCIGGLSISHSYFSFPSHFSVHVPLKASLDVGLTNTPAKLG